MFGPKKVSCALLLVSATCAHDSRASSFETFGANAQALAEVSARAATATDGSASFHNPAGLAFGSGTELELGAVGAWSHLQIQSQDYSLDYGGALIGHAAAELPFRGALAHRLRVGVALHALPGDLMQLRTRGSSEPFYPYYDNRLQRLTVVPALAVRPAKWLGLGMGVNVLAGVQGPLDVREGQSRALETRLDEDAGTQASLVAGVRADPSDRWHLAAVYRQSLGVPVHVITTASVAGVPLVVDVATSQALFDPTTVVLAAGFDATDRLSLELDMLYQRWSQWSGPLLEIDTTVSALSLATPPPQDLYQDTWSARASGRWLMATEPVAFTLHAGVGFESSMLKHDTQQGRTNIVDGPKLLGGLGLSVRAPNVVGRALRASLGMQVHRVGSFEQPKVACTQLPCPSNTVVGPDAEHPSEGITNPGYPVLRASGFAIAGAIGLGVEL